MNEIQQSDISHDCTPQDLGTPRDSGYETKGDISLQRPNDRLLRLGRLPSTMDAISHTDEQSSQNTIQIVSADESMENRQDHVQETSLKIESELPPPSYESIMKGINNSMSSSSPSASQLPSYRDVAGLADAPPSYHSIFSATILRAFNPFNDDEDGATPIQLHMNQQRNKFTAICFNCIIFIFLVTFVLLLPISMLVVGIVYIHQCPVQPRIPIYLIVLGFFQMLECCGRLGYKIFQNQNGHQQNTWRERYRRKDPLVYFMIVWFVIGSMWVYQTDPDCKDCINTSNLHNYTNLLNSTTVSPLTTVSLKDKQTAVYCNKTVYSFAFWVITTYYSMIGLFCFLILIDVVARAISKCCCVGR